MKFIKSILKKAKNLFIKGKDSFLSLPKNKKIIVIALAVLIIILLFTALKSCSKQAVVKEVNTFTAAKGNVSVKITGTGTIEANEQYNITALVTGDVLADHFEEGDILEEGDIMYEIDSAQVSRSIEKQQNSNERTKMEYEEAVSNLNKLSVKSKTSGVVTKVNVKKGDNVSSGTKVIELSDTSNMVLKINFNSNDAQKLYIGQAAEVYLENNMGQLIYGTVSRIGTGTITAQGGVKVTSVEISVTNPGGIKEGDSATAIVGDLACNDLGTFESNAISYVSALVSGEVSELLVSAGDKVSYGDTVVKLTSDSVTKSYKQSAISLKDAEIGLEDLYDNLDKYTIEAPITGTVIEKTTKAGDKLDNQNQSTVMAVIADMSIIKFKMSVDELDIAKLEVGQEAIITADALEGKVFTGYVDNISIVGTTSDGVTTYPVTIVVNDPEGLIPGMNVDATITVKEAKDVLIVPVSAVNRGNIVYVKSNAVKGKKEDDEVAQKMQSLAPDGFTAVKVEVGLSSTDFVEIVSGLKEGDEVVITEAEAQNRSFGFGMMRGSPMGGAPMGGAPMGGGR